MILFSITRLEFSVLYVVRWTCWTKKLDIKITYNFLSICYFNLCLSCCCLNHWSFFSWVLRSFLNFFSPPLLTRHNTTFSPSSCRMSMPRCLSTPRLEGVKARLAREQQSRTHRRYISCIVDAPSLHIPIILSKGTLYFCRTVIRHAYTVFASPACSSCYKIY